MNDDSNEDMIGGDGDGDGIAMAKFVEKKLYDIGIDGWVYYGEYGQHRVHLCFEHPEDRPAEFRP